MKLILFFSFLFLAVSGIGQNIGINITNPDNSAALEIQSNNTGLLIPRMTEAERLAIISPAHSLLVYQTDGQYGYYYNNGGPLSPSWLPLGTPLNTWTLGGNSLLLTGILGTKSNNHLDLISNNITRGRLSNLGEFFIGATGTTIPGDLMGGVSNATFPFAVNGYSAFNGSGVYGSVLSGTTSFAAVQGEYASTSLGAFNTAGVRGTNQSASAGTGFRTLAATGPRVGVIGNTSAGTGQYTFGLHGSMSSTDIRCGGVIGDDFGIALGALGYYASSLNDYSVYGFGFAYQTGVPGGRLAAPEPNTHIGMGIYGGVVGGWIKGLVYGTHLKGERYSLYVDGKTYTNQPVAELVVTDAENRIPVYQLSTEQPEIYARGTGITMDGRVKVNFKSSFTSMANTEDLVITVTPMGPNKGLYIESQDSTGFVVRESGQNSVKFSWIAIASRKGNENIYHSPEILNPAFDKSMDAVMFNDNNTKDKPGHIWYDGKNVRFDQPPAKKPAKDYDTAARVMMNK